jgi:uncharacterized membrane protein
VENSIFAFKSKRLVIQVLVLIVMLGTALAIHAVAADQGFVVIEVTGPDNQPLSGAEIKIAGRSGFTGSEGIARFELKPGRYAFDVFKRGFKSGRMSVTIRSGATVTARIRLSSEK